MPLSGKKRAFLSVGIFAACLLVALALRILLAQEESLHQVVTVSSVRELSDGRCLVQLGEPAPPLRELSIEAITRYPLGYAVVRLGDGTPLRPPAQPAAVRAGILRPGPVTRAVLAFGTIEAEHDARIAVETMGSVRQVHVELGSVVEKGAPLVSLDERDATLGLRRARAELGRSRAALARVERDLGELRRQLAIAAETLEVRANERERWKRLAAREVASADRADQADALWRTALAAHARAEGSVASAESGLAETRAALELAEAGEELALLELERCVVRAPFAGAVAERLVDVGQHVMRGIPVLRLVSQARVRVRVHVREDEAALIRPGAAVALSVPGVAAAGAPYPGNGNGGGSPEHGLPARVVGVSAAADPNSRKLAVDLEAENPHGALRAGLFVRARIDAGRLEAAFLVPDSAVVADEAGHRVYVLDGERVRVRAVVLGARQGEARILRSGLQGPTEIVLEGTALLFDGAPVRRLPAFDAGAAPAPVDAR